jgi:hypothetical protein
MPSIVVKAFNGIKPIVSELLLQPGEAVVAENTRLVSGAMVPLKKTSAVRANRISNPQTIYRFGKSSSEQEYWLEFASDTDVINSPIPDDAWDRVYWADGGTPKYAPSTLAISGSGALPGAYLALGVPAPTLAPEATQSAYASASSSITGTQISLLFVGDLLSVEVDELPTVEITLTGSGGTVTASTLAAQLNGIAGINATVSGTDVEVETESATATSNFKISKKTSETKDYSAGKAQYEGLIGPIYGANADGEAPATPASYTADAALIASIAPDTRLAVTINTNPDVLVTVTAGANTYPSAVTATSFRSALSVSGLNVSIVDGVNQTVKIETVQTGSAATFVIRKVLPAIKPVFTELVSASNTSSASDNETRSYVYTYVTAYGEEGPPSDPSSLVTVNPNAAVNIGSLGLAPSGQYNITAKRIYRTSTVGAQAQFQFVDEVPVATTTYTDSKTQAELGEVLLTQDWVPPPTGLKGLKMMANGAAVGFVENTLYLSEPNLPHAWPHKYPIDYQIVGVAPFRQSVAILTNGHPFLASGADPAAMTLERLEFPHACLSKASIVDTGDGCLYAGADGVVTIGAAGMKVITENLFSREQWQALNPTTMRAYFHDSRYHVLYQDKNNVRGMLIFDFSGQGAVLTTSNINQAAPITAGYSDARTDTLYLAQSGSIMRFNSNAESLIGRWMSGLYRLIKPVNFSFGMVRAQSYPVTFRLSRDNSPIVFQKTVTSSAAFRLPAGYTAQQWRLEVESQHEVNMIAVATSANELQAIT